MQNNILIFVNTKTRSQKDTKKYFVPLCRGVFVFTKKYQFNYYWLLIFLNVLAL